MTKKPITYEQSGVSIDRGDKSARSITELLKSTWDQYLIPNLGGFAGLYNLGARLRDEAEAECGEKLNKVMRELRKKYGEERAPYILLGAWLG